MAIKGLHHEWRMTLADLPCYDMGSRAIGDQGIGSLKQEVGINIQL